MNKFYKNIKIVGLLAGLLVLSATVYLIQKTTRYTSTAAPLVNMYLLPENTSLPPDSTFTLYLDANSQNISFINTELTFDNSMIQLSEDVTTSNSLKTVITKTQIDEANTTGNINLAIALNTEDRNTPPSGLIEVARLPFKLLTDYKGTTPIKINNISTQVVSTDSIALEVNSKNATLYLNGGPASPTPIPQPSPSFSPKPTFTPTPTPSENILLILEPSEDTHVKERYPDRNYGSNSKIISDGYPKTIAYYKFDLRQLDAANDKIQEVQLNITPIKARRVSKLVRVAQNSLWNENLVTWNTQPPLGKTIGSIDGKLSSGVPITVTLDIQEIQNHLGEFLIIAIDDISGGYSLFTRSLNSGLNDTSLKIKYAR